MHQALGDRAFVPQRRQEPPLVGELVAEPAVGQQPRIRVGSVREPVQQCRKQHLLDTAASRGATGQRGQVGQRALRALVAQCGELTFSRFGTHPVRKPK